MRRLFSVLLLLSLLVTAGCGGQQARQPREMQLCSSLAENLTELLAKDFTAASGIKVRVHYLPGGTFAERADFLRQQRFDCWLGGTAEEYYLASRENLLHPYIAEEAYKVPAEMRSNRGYWTSLYLRYIAMISHRGNLHSLGLYAPDTWDELLQPELKGEIVIPDFANGGASYGMLTSIWQLRGREQALAYAARLNANGVTYAADVAEAVEQVYEGEKTVAIIPLDYALRLEAKYRHLFATVVKDANRNLLTGAAVLENGKNLAEAQAFLDYLMSDRSEELLLNNGYQNIWHVKHYPYNDGRRELIGDVHVPADDLSWTAVYKGEIIQEWLRAS